MVPVPDGAAHRGAVLVVEDRDSLRRLMRRALVAQGHSVDAVASRADAEARLGGNDFDLVLSDLRLPDGTGVDVLRWLRRSEEERGDGTRTPFVILTAFGDVASAVEAMKLGASDFLEKPVEIDDLCLLAERLLAAAAQETAPPVADESASHGSRPFEADLASETNLFRVNGAPDIVGAHPQLQAALRLLRRVAPSEGTVLLLGESGTGKELFARGLHALSPRSTGEFVALNCAAVPEALLESELFGHEKGAFTGASARRTGRFEQAEGGTLFLDEIGELQLAVQAKLLRVLEERMYERVGGSTSLHADVRVVAATNVDLEAHVQTGTFRADLYYRLEVFPIRIPPLRDRRSDIPLLAIHLLAKACSRNGIDTPRLTRGAALFLQRQEWPGNVRELANVMERTAILSDGAELHEEQLRDAMPRGAKSTSEVIAAGSERGSASSDLPLGGHFDDVERSQVEQALLDTFGDKHEAARQLGVSYRTLQRRIVRYDLEGFPHYRGVPERDR